MHVLLSTILKLNDDTKSTLGFVFIIRKQNLPNLCLYLIILIIKNGKHYEHTQYHKTINSSQYYCC